MQVLSWNVQYGKSADGRMDFSRCLDHIRSLGDFDVICLQELARNMTTYCVPGQKDHLAMTERCFDGYFCIWSSGFSWPAQEEDAAGSGRGRQEFGNVTLVKSGLLDFRSHQLSQPATPDVYQMHRTAVEAVVETDFGALSILNTHLAFHAPHETQQQALDLHRLEEERVARQRNPKLAGPGVYQNGYLPSARVLCGDFNFTAGSDPYQILQSAGWGDAWRIRHPEDEHLPTCGLFDTAQWPEGAHCRDFFWLSPELHSQAMDIWVDIDSDLSDHQPIMLSLSI